MNTCFDITVTVSIFFYKLFFTMFTKIILDYDIDMFSELSNVTQFEDIVQGRKGAVLIDLTNSKNLDEVKNNLIPIVRTTTKYLKPVQKYQDIHYNIITKIKEESKIEELEFNNSLIEIYDSRYCKMGFHSDQALDLKADSYIAIYSCYKNKPTNLRKVIIKNKQTKELSEITMEHNSVILFSLPTNSQHLHKIILDNKTNDNDNEWLGITFRMSKTFIYHKNNVPYFYPTKKVLTIAKEEERKIFYKLRGKENKKIEFEYPELNFTISVSDTLLA